MLAAFLHEKPISDARYLSNHSTWLNYAKNKGALHNFVSKDGLPL